MSGRCNSAASSGAVATASPDMVDARKLRCNEYLANKYNIYTDDPLLIKWLQAMRFETELECLTSLQARTLAIDEHSACALSIRNSQVNIQEMRLESNFLLDFIDHLIDFLPLDLSGGPFGKFTVEFSELWTQLVQKTAPQSVANGALAGAPGVSAAATVMHNKQGSRHLNHLTIVNSTPRKQQPLGAIRNHQQQMPAAAAATSLKPMDRLATQIRNVCLDVANTLHGYREIHEASVRHRGGAISESPVDNDYLESSLRQLKELYGKFVEISMRAECANIVRALQYKFSQSSLNRLSSTSSLHPVRPFESTTDQIPLKWALIALWQLTKDDSYICRVLTEKWQTTTTAASSGEVDAPKSRAAKRLDFGVADSSSEPKHSLVSDYEKLYELCQQKNEKMRSNCDKENHATSAPNGALSSALKSRNQTPGVVSQVSAIELLIDVIVSQPNKHERLDMMSFVHAQARCSQHQPNLIDLEDLDQNVSQAIYTSNQFKVAALRILNHLCVNDQAVKTILRCLSAPPPKAPGQPAPENKIIRSIFECFESDNVHEHIYQNETVFRNVRKRARQHNLDGATDSGEEHSDYGSRRTAASGYTLFDAAASAHSDASAAAAAAAAADATAGDGDDLVVKEAVRLLVQLTTPFHRSNQGMDYYTLIGRFAIESLVKHLTHIVRSSTATGSREMLLLALTTLANISFITTEPMRLHATIRAILDMFAKSREQAKDLELRDQAVTILANSAEKNLLDVVQSGGLAFVLSCLEPCPIRMASHGQAAAAASVEQHRGACNVHDLIESAQTADWQRLLNIDNVPGQRRPIDVGDEFTDLLDCDCDQVQQEYFVASATSLSVSSCLMRLSPDELSALERIHQKAAVAFARISVDANTTQIVLERGGLKQLVDMCKVSHKRNHSDTVLIACIAALRKMTKSIDREIFRHYNALDLIEIDLNQAIKIYGSQRLNNDTNYGMSHRNLRATCVPASDV